MCYPSLLLHKSLLPKKIFELRQKEKKVFFFLSFYKLSVAKEL